MYSMYMYVYVCICIYTCIYIYIILVSVKIVCSKLRLKFFAFFSCFAIAEPTGTKSDPSGPPKNCDWVPQ